MRFAPLGLLLLLCTAGAPLAGQAGAGSELWRLAAVTVPMPLALATGAAAAFWNPAQRDTGGSRLGLELIQTPDAIGATGVLAAYRFPLAGAGVVGFTYARMGLGDLVRTSDSPDPIGESIPFYTQRAALTWARDFGRSTLGASLSYHDTRIDGATVSRWALDAGIVQRLGERLRLAVATRGFRRFGADPAQDAYAAAEVRLWHGILWQRTSGTLVARYGLTTGHPGGSDHQLGASLDVGTPLSLDVMLAREASYGNVGWRGAAGLRIAVGRYQLAFARDGGISNLGSAFRVGLEARFK
ncbi:MAG: hypothetical protein ACREMF_10360 [Gemmatimonadales bacterium]